MSGRASHASAASFSVRWSSSPRSRSGRRGRAARVVLTPPASEVALRAWDVWPSADFLRAVGASLSGWPPAMRSARRRPSRSGSPWALRLGCGRTLGPTTEFLRALPVIAVVPIAIVLARAGDAMRIAVIAFGVFFPVLIGTVDGVRAVPPEIRDTAALLHVGRWSGALGSTCLPHFRRSSPASARRSRSGSCWSSSPRSPARVTGSASTSASSRPSSTSPRCMPRILFLGLLGYALNRLFLVVERRALAWHYGAVGAPVR